jgi:hypothetical protein
MTDDTYRDDDKEEKKEKKRRRIRRRKMWHSNPHHHQGARPSKVHQLKIMIQALIIWMMRR